MKYELLNVRQIREIYTERIKKDFAPDEVKPLSWILNGLSAGHYACYGAVEEDRIAAYAFFVIDGRNAMVDYLAVCENLRGRGTGSLLIRMMTDDLQQKYDCVLLESEDPDYATDEEDRNVRERRIRFYLHNRLVPTGIRSEVWHVHYRILALPVGHMLPDEEIGRIYSGIYRVMMPEKFYKTMFSYRINAMPAPAAMRNENTPGRIKECQRQNSEK